MTSRKKDFTLEELFSIWKRCSDEQKEEIARLLQITDSTARSLLASLLIEDNFYKLQKYLRMRRSKEWKAVIVGSEEINLVESPLEEPVMDDTAPVRIQAASTSMWKRFIDWFFKSLQALAVWLDKVFLIPKQSTILATGNGLSHDVEEPAPAVLDPTVWPPFPDDSDDITTVQEEEAPVVPIAVINQGNTLPEPAGVNTQPTPPTGSGTTNPAAQTTTQSAEATPVTAVPAARPTPGILTIVKNCFTGMGAVWAFLIFMAFTPAGCCICVAFQWYLGNLFANR